MTQVRNETSTTFQPQPKINRKVAATPKIRTPCGEAPLGIAMRREI
jgi:hypothetical protein